MRKIISKSWGLFFFLVITPLSYAELACNVVPELMRAYLISHVGVRELSSDVKSKSVEQYIKNLDPTKTMLLKSDVEKIRNQLNGLFSDMSSSKCGALEEVQALVLRRARDNEAFVKSFVTDSYKFDENVELILDPEKRDYPAKESEKQDFLRKFIHFQISTYTLAKTSFPEAKKQLIHRYELVTKRLAERDFQELLSNFVKAFSSALDPHSTYFSKDDLEDFQIEMRLSLEGIGASLSSHDGYTVVEEIIAGGAADQKKLLKPKDKIIAVTQGDCVEPAKPKCTPVNVIDMDLRDVVKLIRGKKGSVVTLTVLRGEGNKTERLSFAIERDKVDLKDAEAKITYETRKSGSKTYKLAVIELPSFYGEGERGKRSSYRDMKRLIAQANKAKVDGILLNLARNGGGLLEDAVRISGLFIREGGIVATQNARKNVEILADEDSSTEYAGPLVVLTSRFSASASEILAGALRDYKRAVIVGADHTFGKGTVQAVIPLPKDLGAMKVTTQMFFIPGGQSTQHQGVASNIVLPSPLNNDEIGEKALDYSLPPQKIAAFVGPEANSTKNSERWVELSAEILEKLSANSKARVSKDPKFVEIQKEIAEAEKTKGYIKLAELRKKSQNDKKKDADEKKSVSQRNKDLEAPYIHESLNILQDLIESGKEKSASAAIETRARGSSSFAKFLFPR